MNRQSSSASATQFLLVVLKYQKPLASLFSQEDTLVPLAPQAASGTLTGQPKVSMDA
jgi:hypothetical protein